LVRANIVHRVHAHGQLGLLQLVQGLNRAAAKLKAFGDGITAVGKRMAVLGAAVVTPLFAASQGFAEMSVAKSATRAGASFAALSEPAFAAELRPRSPGRLAHQDAEVPRRGTPAARGFLNASTSAAGMAENAAGDADGAYVRDDSADRFEFQARRYVKQEIVLSRLPGAALSQPCVWPAAAGQTGGCTAAEVRPQATGGKSGTQPG
jgi:hypothetical protein